jgi:hypothetical protein
MRFAESVPRLPGLARRPPPVPVEPKRAENGGYFIWLALGVLARLRALRGPGESYRDVILRVAKVEAGSRD